MAGRFDGITDEQSQRLGRIAVEYISEQVESKYRTGAWGDVTVSLVFRRGLLHDLDLTDHTKVKVTKTDSVGD